MTIKEENFDLLKSLISNNSIVEIDNKKVKKIEWVGNLETYGDLSLSKTLDFIRGKVEQEILGTYNNINEDHTVPASQEDQDNNYQENYLNNIIKQQKDLSEKLDNSDFISFLLDQLAYSSDTKKDLSILILSYLSSCT